MYPTSTSTRSHHANETHRKTTSSTVPRVAARGIAMTWNTVEHRGTACHGLPWHLAMEHSEHFDVSENFVIFVERDPKLRVQLSSSLEWQLLEGEELRSTENQLNILPRRVRSVRREESISNSETRLRSIDLFMNRPLRNWRFAPLCAAWKNPLARTLQRQDQKRRYGQ